MKRAGNCWILEEPGRAWGQCGEAGGWRWFRGAYQAELGVRTGFH